MSEWKRKQSRPKPQLYFDINWTIQQTGRNEKETAEKEWSKKVAEHVIGEVSSDKNGVLSWRGINTPYENDKNIVTYAKFQPDKEALYHFLDDDAPGAIYKTRFPLPKPGVYDGWVDFYFQYRYYYSFILSTFGDDGFDVMERLTADAKSRQEQFEWRMITIYRDKLPHFVTDTGESYPLIQLWSFVKDHSDIVLLIKNDYDTLHKMGRKNGVGKPFFVHPCIPSLFFDDRPDAVDERKFVALGFGGYDWVSTIPNHVVIVHPLVTPTWSALDWNQCVKRHLIQNELLSN